MLPPPKRPSGSNPKAAWPQQVGPQQSAADRTLPQSQAQNGGVEGLGGLTRSGSGGAGNPHENGQGGVGGAGMIVGTPGGAGVGGGGAQAQQHPLQTQGGAGVQGVPDICASSTGGLAKSQAHGGTPRCLRLLNT